MIKNQRMLLKLIELFQEHEGYWSINQSETTNMEITWSPFIGNGKGGMVDTIHTKRVYDVKDFFDEAIKEISPFIKTH